MNTEDIQHFMKSNKVGNEQSLKITFKKREPVFGIILHSKETEELEKKNFWRIVTATYLEEWQKSKNISVTRLFNGSDFTKLTMQ